LVWSDPNGYRLNQQSIQHNKKSSWLSEKLQLIPVEISTFGNQNFPRLKSEKDLWQFFQTIPKIIPKRDPSAQHEFTLFNTLTKHMPKQSNYVLPKDQFKYLLNLECKRAERYQYFFSILLVELASLDSRSTNLSAMSDLIRNLIRESDTMGRVQYNRLAILLCFADNPSSISKRIVKRIQNEIPRTLIKVGEACFPVNASKAEDLISRSVDSII